MMTFVKRSIANVMSALAAKRTFHSSSYWIRRYENGGDSAAPRFPKTCQFKATILNEFVTKHSVNTVAEIGCGEGVQAKLFNIPHYTGYDISPSAIRCCRERFGADNSRKFLLLSEFEGNKYDMTLSFDVIYHLVEDTVFHAYMLQLFRSASRYVGIFSPDEECGSPRFLDR